MKSIHRNIKLPRKFKTFVIAGILAAAGVVGGCSRSEAVEVSGTAATERSGDEQGTLPESGDPATVEFYAMDTIMQVQAYGADAQKAVEAAQTEVERLDALLSTGREDSEVSMINASGSGTLGQEGSDLLKRSLELYEDTDGAFDVTIYPLMELWGFAVRDTTQETADMTSSSDIEAGAEAELVSQHVPDNEELSQKLRLVNSAEVIFDELSGQVTLDEGMQIDFGGIAKGYTSSRLMDILAENGVESGLVTLGGNVQVLGSKPDGSPWKVGIQDPDNEGGILCGIAVTDKAVVTSGGYQRFFEEDGVTYHHIIDPATGYPADSGLKSVTIVSADGTLADGLATAVYIMGQEKAAQYWREHREDFDMILVETDGSVLITEGIVPNVLGEISFEKIS